VIGGVSRLSVQQQHHTPARRTDLVDCGWDRVDIGPGTGQAVKLELMELENIVANTVYLKAREGNLGGPPPFSRPVTHPFLV